MNSSRTLDLAAVVLLPVMLISLCCAIAAGTLQILWTGNPMSQTAATVSFVFAFLFGGALMIAFLFAAYTECKRPGEIKPTDPNEFGAEV